MRMIAKKKWLLLGLALVLTLAVPTLSHASSWLSRWWLGSSTAAIADVEFSTITTTKARLAHVSINRFRINGTERISFDEVDLTATVAGGVLTFDQIVLTEGTTTVTVVIDPATLRTDVLGSSFKTIATVIVETEDGTAEFEALVRGRIATRKGVYHLSATLLGHGITRISKGTYLIDLFSLSLTGSVDEPDAT